jgi:integrase
MPRPTPSLEQIFQAHIQSLALTLRPETVNGYRGATRRFLSYLHAAFPRVRRLSQLRRDPHLLGWFRSLCEQQPPLSNKFRINLLLCLRRLLEDLAANGLSLAPDLIRREDFPPPPHYLPRPLSPQDDQLLQQELRRTDDLPALAPLLTRATGIRIGECIDLALDCLQQIGPDQWALHVPIGKLHTERLVPADADIVARILALRASAPPPVWPTPTAYCCPAPAAMTLSTKRFSRHSPIPLNEPAAPALSRRTACGTASLRRCSASVSAFPLSCDCWGTTIFA